MSKQARKDLAETAAPLVAASGKAVAATEESKVEKPAISGTKKAPAKASQATNNSATLKTPSKKVKKAPKKASASESMNEDLSDLE